jgi:uncharacterized protein with von Willebrand factor type A (vWA) domain
MALRVGLDLVAVSTVVESLRGPHRDRYLERVFTDAEIADCRAPGGVSPTQIEVVRERMQTFQMRETSASASPSWCSSGATVPSSCCGASALTPTPTSPATRS